VGALQGVVDERAEVDLDDLVGELVGIGVGAAEGPGGAGELLVLELRGEELVDEGSLLCEFDEGNEEGGRVVLVDVAVGEEEGADAVGIAGEEVLGDEAAAVVGDEVDGVDVEGVEELGEHVGLGVGGDGLALWGLGVAEAHDVGCDAAAVSLEAVEGAAPLEAVEWVAVDEEGCGAVAALDVGDTADGEVGELARGVEGGCVDGGCGCCVGERLCEQGCACCCGTVEELSSSHLFFSVSVVGHGFDYREREGVASRTFGRG
jgi:hypothetical protein